MFRDLNTFMPSGWRWVRDPINAWPSAAMNIYVVETWITAAPVFLMQVGYSGYGGAGLFCRFRLTSYPADQQWTAWQELVITPAP